MKLIKSELSPYEPAYNNIRNALTEHEIFDKDWFSESGNEDKEHLYDEFIDQFADWLETQDELVTKLNEYRNQDFDVEYYFKEYMEDYDADHTGIEGLYNAVEEWVKGEDDFANSLDYAHSMYSYESGAADIEFYTQDVKDNAERIFKAQRYTEEDVTHGFKNAQDMEDAVWKAIDNGGLTDVDEYDGGSYGSHASVDGTEEYFETGCLFLGNSELEYQMQTSVPFSADNDFSGQVDCHSPYNWYGVSERNPDLIYTNPTWIFVYGVKWEDVERAGDELGLRGEKESSGNDISYDEDDIPRF